MPSNDSQIKKECLKIKYHCPLSLLSLVNYGNHTNEAHFYLVLIFFVKYFDGIIEKNQERSIITNELSISYFSNSVKHIKFI